MTWRVQVRIGGHTIDGRQLEPGVDRYIDEMPLPALLSVSWIDQLDEWPALHGPSTGSLVIRFAEAISVASMGPWTRASIDFYRNADDAEPAATFRGRASYPEFTLHDKGIDARFSIVDLLSDLTHGVGDDAYPEENARARLNRVFAEAGLVLSTAGYSDPPVLAARQPSAQTLLALAQQTLSWSVWTDPSNQPTLLELRPAEHFGWTVAPVPRVLDAEGILIWDEGRWEAGKSGFGLVDDLPTDAVISPAWIVAGFAWVRTPLPVGLVHVITASKVRRTASWDPIDSATLRVETELVENVDADRLADYLLPSDAVYEMPQWEAHQFTVALDRTPDGYWPGDLRDVRVIPGLQTRHNPTRDDWTAGVVLSREIRIERGRCDVEMTLGSRAVRDGAIYP